MANINDVYAGNWLSAEDLQMNNGQYRDVSVVIERTEVQQFEDKERGQMDTKVSLHFQGKAKGMVLNKTNARMLGWAFGPDTDNWTGKQITVGVDIVPFGNRMVPGLRVRQLAQQLPQQQPAQANSGGMVPVQNAGYNQDPNDTGQSGLDDDIPF